MNLRILTYNIHWGVGTDGVYDLSRVAHTIRQSGADVVALQEVHAATKRFAENQLEVLAALCGMPHHTLGATMRGYPQCPPAHAGHGEYGNALLSRWPLTDIRVMHFTRGAGFSRSQEPRGAVYARVQLPGMVEAPYVLSTHLGCDITGYEQCAAVPELLAAAEVLRGEKGGVMLCGDFNAGAWRRCVQMVLEKGWGDSWLNAPGQARSYLTGCTMPSYFPVTRIDYIFYNNSGWKLTASMVLAGLAGRGATVHPSDHFPVLATFTLEEAPIHGAKKI